MPLLDLVILAIIQGITEFLPISSSGHLILWPLLTGRPDQGVALDIAVHLGTLIAVCLYFRAETARLAIGSVHLLTRRWETADARLAFLVGIATVPAIAFGLGLKLSGLIEDLRAIEVIGWATLIGGILLWLADRFGPQRRAELPRETPEGDVPGWRLQDAVIMGLAQALALIPGTSRAGITMTAARALGFEREEAARLSLVMAIPVILAAAAVEIVSIETTGVSAAVVATPEGSLALRSGLYLDMAIAGGLSCIAAFIAMIVMFRMFRARWTMTPFVLYRLALGVALLAIA
ncbi:MAG: undecaprenyl-diphosphate phosphatase, partial [Pseudomonadota bacterium]